jgi:hypothetical protein
VFTNINPTTSRVWNVGEPFDILAPRMAHEAGLRDLAARASSPLRRTFRRGGYVLRRLGLPLADRSPYDSLMLYFHDYLKENQTYQETCVKTRLEFPPGATWLVFTDGVPHAALSGRFALEQTYLVGVDALCLPQKAPLNVLAALSGLPLTH